MISLFLAPFIGLIFMGIAVFISGLIAASFPSYGFLVWPVFIVTNGMVILGSIIRGRTK